MLYCGLCCENIGLIAYPCQVVNNNPDNLQSPQFVRCFCAPCKWEQLRLTIIRS